MTNLSKIAAATLFGLATLTLVATTASAAIVCNAEGYCWHVRRHFHYLPAWGLVVHPNSWRWGPNERYVWREHRGRGYWRGRVWVRF